MFKVIPLYCIAHPYCARFIASLAHAHTMYRKWPSFLYGLGRERDKSSFSRKRVW